MNSFPLPFERDEKTNNPNEILVNKVVSFSKKLDMLPKDKIAVALGIKEDEITKKHMIELQKDLIWALKTSKKEIFMKNEEKEMKNELLNLLEN